MKNILIISEISYNLNFCRVSKTLLSELACRLDILVQERFDIVLPLGWYSADVLVIQARVYRLVQLLLVDISEGVADVSHDHVVGVVLYLTEGEELRPNLLDQRVQSQVHILPC